jgi:phosphatidate phosphatase APP1
VLEDKNITKARDNDSVWTNLVNMYKRFESDEIPHARLRARYMGIEKELIADEEGMFDLHLELPTPIEGNHLWHEVELTLLSPIVEDQKNPVQAKGEIFIPPDNADFVVISDIDDTVLKTDAVHLVQMARNVFLGNARTRLPFPGVAALYRALLAGSKGGVRNPLFYVSSSPWNLYDLLAEFFHLQDIPIGPVLFLRQWGISENELLPVKNKEYKHQVIKHLLELYAPLPFILIGDSGQEDPEIYHQVVAEFPERVLAVYIRNVNKGLERSKEINQLAEDTVKAGSTLILANDTLTIADHAHSKGLIQAEAFQEIMAEIEKDKTPNTPIEQLIADVSKEEEENVTVTIEAHSPDEKEAVDEGLVEQTVKEFGKEGKPPDVIVSGDEDSEDKLEER